MHFANVGNYVMLLFYIQFYLNLSPFTEKHFEFCLDILNAKLLITKMKTKNILIFNIEPEVLCLRRHIVVFSSCDYAMRLYLNVHLCCS